MKHTNKSFIALGHITHIMRISHYITISAAILAAGLFIGCSKSPSKAAASKMSHTTSANALSTTISTTNASAALIDWGVVELSPNTPKHLSLGDGADCTLTTTLSADGKLAIAISSKGKTTAEDNIPGFPVGTPTKLTQTMTVTSGTKIISCYVGSKLVSFTPELQAP
jgi:hypothetical protein